MSTAHAAPSAAIEASVVVPTHSGAHRLSILLDALVAQDFTGSWEAVLVVDGVVDGTLAMVESYADRLPLRLVVNELAQGTCRALNEGYAAAQGRVLIRCDDDLTPRPDMVARHVGWHDRPGLHGVIGATRDVFPDTAYSRVYGRRTNERALAASYARTDELLWVNWAAHNSVTREAWDLAGGFDERFVYGQDSELGWRLRQAGVTFHLDPDLEIEHRGPTTSATNRVPRAFVAGASRRLFLQVHAGAAHPADPPAGLSARAWDVAISLAATMLRSREAYRRLGALTDRLLPRLPATVGARLVAFGVEAAGRSGLRHGSTDLSSFKDQKGREVRSELSSRS